MSTVPSAAVIFSRSGLSWAEMAYARRRSGDCARMSSLQRVEKVLVGLVGPVSRHEKRLRPERKGVRRGGRPLAGRVVRGRGRVGHVGRVGTIMRVAGARVCAVVGAEAGSRSALAKTLFRSQLFSFLE